MHLVLRITLPLLIGAGAFAWEPLSARTADPKREAMIEERFKAADKNGDGKLTHEEANAGMPRIATNFDRIDSDRRGYITLDQIKKAALSR